MSSILSNLKAKITNNQEFINEDKLLQGENVITGDHPSIIHFSVNKAATQYVKKILSRCIAQNQMLHIQMNEYAFNSSLPYLDHLNQIGMRNYQHIFKSKGFLYSAFGGFVESIDNLGEYKILLFIRDPRDVLVSSFYSTAYSHSLPKGSFKEKIFMQDRIVAQKVGINKYVLSECEKVKKYYEKYINLLLVNYPSSKVLKYEDMISDFQTWLDEILTHCDLKISEQLKNDLLNEANASKSIEENQNSQKRQIFPGDYLRKLEADTVDYLNTNLSDILTCFDYPT